MTRIPTPDHRFEQTWNTYLAKLEEFRQANRDRAAARQQAQTRDPHRTGAPHSLSDATLKAGPL